MLLTTVKRWKIFTLDCQNNLQQQFSSFLFYWKSTCIKELCQKSFENILNYIMQNSTYTQEKIISASVKTLQIKLFLLSPAMLFTLRSACMSSIATLVNKVYTAIKNVPYCHQTINLAVGAMVESLHTWLKTSLAMSVLRLVFVFEKSYIDEPKWSLT